MGGLILRMGKAIFENSRDFVARCTMEFHHDFPASVRVSSFCCGSDVCASLRH
jgi:hypothetical protein